VDFLLLQPDLIPSKSAIRRLTSASSNPGPVPFQTVLDSVSIEATRMALQPQYDALADRL